MVVKNRGLLLSNKRSLSWVETSKWDWGVLRIFYYLQIVALKLNETILIRSTPNNRVPTDKINKDQHINPIYYSKKLCWNKSENDEVREIKVKLYTTY